MNRIRPLALLVSCLLTVACESRPEASPEVDTEAEARELMRLSREWSETVASGDMEAALDYWADDAVVMAPGMPPIRGKEAIREYVSAAGQIPGFRISWEPVEAHVAPSGELAYLLEENRITVNDSTGTPVTEHNKVVTVWKKQPDGTWKNVVDMWNGQPPAGR